MVQPDHYHRDDVHDLETLALSSCTPGPEAGWYGPTELAKGPIISPCLISVSDDGRMPHL